jgi:hypothetical protein
MQCNSMSYKIISLVSANFSMNMHACACMRLEVRVFESLIFGIPGNEIVGNSQNIKPWGQDKNPGANRSVTRLVECSETRTKLTRQGSTILEILEHPLDRLARPNAIKAEALLTETVRPVPI